MRRNNTPGSALLLMNWTELFDHRTSLAVAVGPTEPVLDNNDDKNGPESWPSPRSNESDQIGRVHHHTRARLVGLVAPLLIPCYNVP
jgi:hypothetical protein